MFGLRKFDMYLDMFDMYLTIQTDHQALTWLKNHKNPAGRLARWAFTLQGHDFLIVYRPGKKKLRLMLCPQPLPSQQAEQAELVAVTNAEFS